MAGAQVATNAQKPQLRHLLRDSFRKHIIFSSALVLASGIAFKVFIGDARKKRYAEFAKTYDADAEFEAMRKKGVFQSC